jgi:hypothetical protein
MADTRRTYCIELSPDAPVPSLRELVREQFDSGALWWDLIEIKHGDRIVAFGVMHDVARRKSTADAPGTAG